MRAIILATIAAIAIQPLFFALYFLLPFALVGEGPSLLHEVFGMLMLVIVFAAGFVIVLGLPIFFTLRYFKRDNWWTLAVSGFLAGGFPIGLLSWPSYFSSGDSSYSGNWHGRYVDFVVHGTPTIYGWLSYAEGTLISGLHGLIGALAFFFVWRRNSHTETTNWAN
jgi:hypothetical protein